VSAVAFPLFLTVPIGIFCLYRFPLFYEIVPIFFIHDVLYGVANPRFFGIPYVMTLFAIIGVALVAGVRKSLFVKQKMQ
jgi:hypothetical protein